MASKAVHNLDQSASHLATAKVHLPSLRFVVLSCLKDLQRHRNSTVALHRSIIAALRGHRPKKSCLGLWQTWT